MLITTGLRSQVGVLGADSSRPGVDHHRFAIASWSTRGGSLEAGPILQTSSVQFSTWPDPKHGRETKGRELHNPKDPSKHPGTRKPFHLKDVSKITPRISAPVRSPVQRGENAAKSSVCSTPCRGTLQQNQTRPITRWPRFLLILHHHTPPHTTPKPVRGPVR